MGDGMMNVKQGEKRIKQVDTQTRTQTQVDSCLVAQLTWAPAATLPQGQWQVYIDNIAIHTRRENSETEAEHQAQHQEYIHQVLNKLEENNLYLKLEKCKFLK